jgi:hypothetical protein
MLRLVLALAALSGCASAKTGLLRLQGAPPDAFVTIDDQYVGKLERLKKFGVKLPAGEHRITIEATGYFPHDQLVRVPPDGDTKLDVRLEEIPD